jgi:hypothetical protein
MLSFFLQMTTNGYHGKNLVCLKIVMVFMKCKAQAHRLYLIRAFLSQKEKGKTLLGFKQKSIGNLDHHFFHFETKLVPIPPSFHHTSRFTSLHFFHFLNLCSGAIVMTFLVRECYGSPKISIKFVKIR